MQQQDKNKLQEQLKDMQFNSEDLKSSRNVPWNVQTDGV